MSQKYQNRDNGSKYNMIMNNTLKILESASLEDKLAED